MENGCCMLMTCPDTSIPCYKCTFFIECEKCDNYGPCVMGYAPSEIETLFDEE